MIRDEEEDSVSRSQKKRDSTAVQAIGAALAALPKADLENFGLPEPLLLAIVEWKKFTSHEAKRRQMQYIGRLMRDMDVAALQERLTDHLAPSRAERAAQQALEKLRDSLVAAEDEELETELRSLAARWPSAPIPRLRHLGQTAKAERAANKPPRAYRELFRLLRDLAATDKD